MSAEYDVIVIGGGSPRSVVDGTYTRRLGPA
jgi:hypothetical protein